MSEKLCTVSLLHELLSGRNAARENSTAEDSRLCSRPSAARFLAPTRLVAVSIISRPTASVCAIRSSMPKVCVLPPAWSRPDARWLLGRASNAPACTGPNKAPTPSLLSAAQNSVVGFKTSGSADQNAGPRDPSLSWRAPGLSRAFREGERRSGRAERPGNVKTHTLENRKGCDTRHASSPPAGIFAEQVNRAHDPLHETAGGGWTSLS